MDAQPRTVCFPSPTVRCIHAWMQHVLPLGAVACVLHNTSALEVPVHCSLGACREHTVCMACFPPVLADFNIAHMQSGHLRTFPADFIFYICSTLQVLWRSSFQQLSHYTSCVEAIVFSTTQPLHFICCGGRLFDNSAATLHVLRQSSFRQLRHYTSCVVAVVFPTTQPLHFMCCGGRLFDN